MNTEIIQNIIRTATRYERKFTVLRKDRREIIFYIKNNPAFFRDVYYTRQVNNIYLDTSQFQFYNDNKTGIAHRKKVRIRWYGNLQGDVSQPKLEYKLKDGLAGNKIIFNLPNFNLSPNFSKYSLKEIFEKANLPNSTLRELRNLVPTLINTYQRQYYISADNHFRLTLDQNLTYYYFYTFKNTLLKKEKELNAHVIELKYRIEQDLYANKIANFFPYRLDKKSKYITGIDFFR